MTLKDLYRTFLENGYTNFYIDGVGGPMSDDVHRLGFDGVNWTVYYIERGRKSDPILIMIIPNKVHQCSAAKYTTFFEAIRPLTAHDHH